MYIAHFDCNGEKLVGVSNHSLARGEVVPIQIDGSYEITFLHVLSVTPSGVNGDVLVRANKTISGISGSMAIVVRPDLEKNGAP